MTVEEIFIQKQEEQRQDNLKDNYGTTLGTTLKSSSNKERDNLDNLFKNLEENKKNLKNEDEISPITTSPSTVMNDEKEEKSDTILLPTEDVSDKVETKDKNSKR